MITRQRAAWAALLLGTTAVHADIYKWVDGKGQTHYSERKADANGARTSEVIVPSAPAAPLTSTPSTTYLRASSPLAPPPPPTMAKSPPTAASGKAPPSLSDGREHGSDASRCALAKDVLSGAVVHGNGKPTDKYDREVARNDVKAFCKGR